MSTFEQFVPQPGYEYQKPQDAVALTVSGGATPADTSDAIEVKKTTDIALQVSNTDSTSLKVEVFASIDGVIFDDQPYAEMTVGADQEKTLSITPGPKDIKVKVDNQDAGNATVVTTVLGKTY